MDVPSIKGTGIAQTVADVKRLEECGRIDRAQLEARLESEDLRLLDGKVQVAVWYPNACHRRLTELLRDVEGGGREEYVVQRGRDTADRLIEGGLYQQLHLVEDGEVGVGRAVLRRSIRLMLSMAASIYSFGRWALLDEDEDDTLRVVVEEARHLSEMNRLTAQGFIDRTAERILGYDPRVRSRRRDPNVVEITIRIDPDRTR